MSDRWTDRLSEYLDDELGAQERRELAAHLDGCAECAAALAQLRQVVVRAGTLTDREPATDLWPDIAARIRGEDGSPAAVPAPRPTRAGRPARRLPRRVFSFTLPQLAATALAVALASAGLMWLFGAALDARLGTRRGAVPPTLALPAGSGEDLSYDRAIDELRRALAEGRGELDSTTVRVLEQNLAAIEQSIGQSRRALAADPANPYLREHLQETMRSKLALLQRATLVASAR
jgi:hypothetical protein